MTHNRFSKPILPLSVIGAVLLVCGGLIFADWWISLPENVEPTYVGRQTCAECHPAEAHQWKGSHHDLAMARATPETVLGDFDGSELSHYGITSRMYRRDGKYLVRTEGPDGEMGDFEVKYVLGVEPLQQYMVEFDRREGMSDEELGRVQVLRISWDTHEKKWFYLPPPDVDEKLCPEDDLHWTGIAQRWNNMCADCHSTNLQKNYDHETATYQTTFSEINVSCVACHGPGSTHVELARKKSLFWDRKQGYGLARLKDADPEIEIQTCAPCHARRRVVYPDFRPGENLYDYFANELLQPLTYHCDGQILDEVYEHGSFIQSKMYHKQVRCTDCHNPHTAKLKHEGNKLCTSCHAHPAGKYDSPSHHHHKPGSPGASCVECHMPQTTYMEVDPRRDHSLRPPRPDLSVKLKTPNACTGCHLDDAQIDSERREGLKQYADWLLAAREGDEQIGRELERLDRWADEKVVQWYGRRPADTDSHFAHALAAARGGQQRAEPKLIAVAKNKALPALVRATAVMHLGQYGSRESLAVSQQNLKDGDPQVRAAAAANLQALPHRERIKALVPLLQDPVRLVRTEAARALADVPRSTLTGRQRRAFLAALDELKQGLLVNNDRAAAHLTLALLHEQQGQQQQALQAYETAIRVEPQMVGPRTNLAALLDALAEAADRDARREAGRGDLERAHQLAQQALEHRQRAKTLREEELPRLARDARLAPDNAALQHRYGLSLYLHGQHEEAEQALLAATRLEPQVPDFQYALALFYQRFERWEEALHTAQQLLDQHPNEPAYQQLMQSLRQQRGEGAAPTN